MNKGNFKLKLGSALLIGASLTLAGCGNGSDSSSTKASMILKNGTVYTMDGAANMATAVAIEGDKIIYVGDDAGVEQYVGNGTEVIDLNGKMVTPGFVDGHSHPPEHEIAHRLNLTLGELEPSIEVYQQALREYREANPDLQAIWGVEMQLNAFGDAGPNKSILDEIVSDIPIIIQDTSHHGAWLNSKALELSGITRDTEDPAGGKIYKDDNGEPTGYLSDAIQLVSGDIYRPEVTQEIFIDAFKEFEQDSISKGITATHALYLKEVEDTTPWQMLSEHAAAGDMKMRVGWQTMATGGLTTADDIIQILNAGQQYASDWQNLRTVKTFVDGVPEGKTSFLLEPYAPESGAEEDYRGTSNWAEAEYQAFVAAIDKAGYQTQTHAMGDASARMVIDAVEQAYVQNGERDGRHVMVHANLVDPADIPHMGQLDIYAAMQPIWFYSDPIFSALELQMLGQERFDQEYSVRDMMDVGIIISGSSDVPVTPDNRPLAGIETGVTQGAPYPGLQGDDLYVRDGDQTVSVMDMLKVYTINGAKQMFMEDSIGSIEVDKKADLVILAQDITTINPVDISETEVVKTIVNGKTVYSQE